MIGRIYNMKNVAIFGGPGHTGLYITRKLIKEDDVRYPINWTK